MRQIKFRARDTLTGQWVQFDKPPAHTTGRSTSKILVLRGPDDSVVFQQFTGLTDKNGKEIYEGDILRLSCGYVQGSTDHSITATVIYDDDRFRADMHDKKMLVHGGQRAGQTLPQYEVHSWVGMHTCLRETPRHLEVIGNIYENPELLN